MSEAGIGTRQSALRGTGAGSKGLSRMCPSSRDEGEQGPAKLVQRMYDFGIARFFGLDLD